MIKTWPPTSRRRSDDLPGRSGNPILSIPASPISLIYSIHCGYVPGSGSQNQVFQQELSRQGKQGETCRFWSSHENGQGPGKQDQTEQANVT
nr:hypothetical protein [Ktedonobacter racemifer]